MIHLPPMGLEHILEGYLLLLGKQVGMIEPALIELAQQRLTVCSTCEQFEQLKHKCNICSCYMPAKALVKNESCPQYFW